MLPYDEIASAIRRLHGRPEGEIPLHEPRFGLRERDLLLDCLDSTFVSSVGAYVGRAEEMLQEVTGAAHAVATVNGTSALHAALLACGVGAGAEVLTQPLTFVATANAVHYCGAQPVFLDVDRTTLGMSPQALERFLIQCCERRTDGTLVNRGSGRRVAACLPVHIFGHPCAVDKIAALCASFDIPLVEDAAEALGSRWQNRHCGTFGRTGVLSFNGNKIVTCGGGGAVLTDDAELARRLKHLTTTAKAPHPWRYEHNETGYNYRLPNLNAALLCAQLEQLEAFIADKRRLAAEYTEFFQSRGMTCVQEPAGGRANCWLNAILLDDAAARDAFLAGMHERGILCRPAWGLMHRLPMYAACEHDALTNASWLEARLVNLPSSVRCRKDEQGPGRP
ncbi:MAG: aminotransferase DegT [Desulfobulbaceae bacterium A2]|nr:MAG: aminotransferase DegT [Desulfobulbaceae bacterium A2]